MNDIISLSNTDQYSLYYDTKGRKSVYTVGAKKYHVYESKGILSKMGYYLHQIFNCFSSWTMHEVFLSGKKHSFLVKKIDNESIDFEEKKMNEIFNANISNPKSLSILPDEILLSIFSSHYLPSILKMSLLSKQFLDLSNKNELWKPIALRLTPDTLPKIVKKNNSIKYKDIVKENIWILSDLELYFLKIMYKIPELNALYNIHIEGLEKFLAINFINAYKAIKNGKQDFKLNWEGIHPAIRKHDPQFPSRRLRSGNPKEFLEDCLAKDSKFREILQNDFPSKLIVDDLGNITRDKIFIDKFFQCLNKLLEKTKLLLNSQNKCVH